MAIVKQVASLLPKLATDLAGCGEPDKLAALQRCLLDFCRRSRVWREEIDVTLAAGAASVDLPWSCEARAMSIDGLKLDGVTLAYGGAAHSRRVYLGESSTGTQQQLTLSEVLNESAASTLTVAGTLVPAGVDPLVPDWLLDAYGDAIVSGAMAILKAHKGKPYSDLDGAMAAGNDFRRGIAYACLDGARRVGKGES
jgi:hypothetical protein